MRHASNAFSSRRRRLLQLAATLPALTLATSKTACAAPATSSDVTLVLGDQAGGARALVEAAGVLQNAPFAFRWANFQGAAPLFEAQRAGAVDLAPAGDLPVLTAATGDPSLRIVAARVGSGAQLGILVQPDSAIRTVADLKGRDVVVSSARGSISQYQLYGALAEAGLSRTDVNVRFVLPVDAYAAFESRQIEVWATFDPYFGSAVQRGGRVLRDGRGINSGLGFITAPQGSLADPVKRHAIIEALRLYQAAGDWALAHPAAYAQVYANLTHLPLDAASAITARASIRQHFITPDDIAILQRIADTAVRQGILPTRIDVASISAVGLGNA